jgi:hypothetical protein
MVPAINTRENRLESDRSHDLDDLMPIRTYRHSPRPTGSPISFTLEGDRLTVDSGRRLQEVRLGAVEEVRMTYEPCRFAQRAYQTKIRLRDGKSFAFSFLDWKSLIEADRLDPEYRVFARALFDAIALASPQARFVAGRPRWIWFATAALAASSLLVMMLFIWRALQSGATSAALMGGLFLAAGIWQLEPMVRLNKPRTFRPGAPPADLLP